MYITLPTVHLVWGFYTPLRAPGVEDPPAPNDARHTSCERDSQSRSWTRLRRSYQDPLRGALSGSLYGGSRYMCLILIYHICPNKAVSSITMGGWMMS